MEQNKQNTAKVVAMKMAERMNQPATTGEKKKGVLVIIDGKPPVADNTTLMLYTVKLRAVDERKPTAYFSITESNVQVVNRLIAITTGIDHEKIVSGQLSDEEWAQIDEKLPALMDAPLYVDDTPDMTLADLRMKMAGLAEKGVTLVVIDHAQQVTADGMDADAVLDGIKILAEELHITVIAVVD